MQIVDGDEHGTIMILKNTIKDKKQANSWREVLSRLLSYHDEQGGSVNLLHLFDPCTYA